MTEYEGAEKEIVEDEEEEEMSSRTPKSLRCP